MNIPRAGVSAWAELLVANGWHLLEGKSVVQKDSTCLSADTADKNPVPDTIWLPRTSYDSYEKDARKVLRQLVETSHSVKCAMEAEEARLIAHLVELLIGALEKNAHIEGRR